MMAEQKLESYLDLYVGCFGNYRRSDTVCRTRCALNLRCAIEYEQNERFEILEELVSVDGMATRFN